MDLETLSPKQKHILAHAASDSTSCFAGGAIRSGKTFSSSLSFALWILREGMGYDHALIGYTLEAVMRNVGWPREPGYASAWG